MEITSYRAVFDLERRIYRIDSLRLNPAGIPLRGIVYYLALLGGVLLAGRLPLVGGLSAVAPWYLRGLIFPAIAAAVLTVVQVEGRPFHLACWAILCHGTRCWNVAGALAWPVGARWHPPDLLVIVDGSEARVRRLLYTGPGSVSVNIAHALGEPAAGRGKLGPWPSRRPVLTLGPPCDGSGRRACRLELGPRVRLEVASPPRSRWQRRVRARPPGDWESPR